MLNMEDKSLVPAQSQETQLSTMQSNISKLFKKKTPKEVIKQRPGPGGKMFPYVPIDYVVSELDRVFGIFWEHVIEDIRKTDTHIIVRGKIVIKSPSGFSVSRPGIGRAVIKFFKDSTKPVDEGNDEKAAVSDSIKKAASLFGIAADVYYKELEKYEEIQSQQTEDEALLQKATGKYFAMASERGLSGDVAKEKVKKAFKVAHMADLTLSQLNHACVLLEKNYEIVDPGEEPRKKGEPAPTKVEESVAEGEVLTEGLYFCQGPKHKPKDSEQVKVPVGEFCSEECKVAYWGESPKSSYDRDWDNLGKS